MPVMLASGDILPAQFRPDCQERITAAMPGMGHARPVARSGNAIDPNPLSERRSEALRYAVARREGQAVAKRLEYAHAHALQAVAAAEADVERMTRAGLAGDALRIAWERIVRLRSHASKINATKLRVINTSNPTWKLTPSADKALPFWMRDVKLRAAPITQAAVHGLSAAAPTTPPTAPTAPASAPAPAPTSKTTQIVEKTKTWLNQAMIPGIPNYIALSAVAGLTLFVAIKRR